MRILLGSSDEYARSFTDKLADSMFQTSIATTVEFALEKAPEANVIILDATLNGKSVLIFAHKFLNISVKQDVYVRFDENAYDTETYEALISMGIAGQFCGWPTATILDHELVGRRGETRLQHERFGQIKLTTNRKIHIGDKEGKFTEKEAEIFAVLARSRGTVIRRKELLTQVWGYNPNANTHTIETHIYRLRATVEKLLPDGTKGADLIVTKNGGYMLAV